MIFVNSLHLQIEKGSYLAAALLLLAGEMAFRESRSFRQLNAFVDAVFDSAPETLPPESFPSKEGEAGEEWQPLGLQTRTIYVTCGDTLSSILSELGISLRDIDAISKALAKVHNVRHLQIGQALDVQWEASSKGSKLKLLELEGHKGNRLSLVAKGEGYDVTVNQRVLVSQWVTAHGVIRTNFSSASKEAGIPAQVYSEVLQALNPLIKPHRLQASTSFDVVYEEKRDATSGKRVGKPALRYVAMACGEQLHKIYVFGNQYYSEKGESLKTEFLVLPLKNKNVGITSKFGMRRHPILGVVKKHYGVDYAARYGTDVFAAANGVVVAAGSYGAYGLYVRIKHANGFETAYGHLSSISVKKGDVVSQGDKIGKVGSSGRATGPHLHHEVIRNQVRVDPQKYTSLGTTRLAGKDMARFRKFKEEVSEQLNGEPTDV